MKKKILVTLIVLLVLAAYGVLRMGTRSITINVDGTPAAGEKIRLLSTGEIIDLDDDGALKLPWGLAKQENPGFFYQAPNQAIWLLRLPDKGVATFNISGPSVVTDLETSYGLFKLRRQITQTHTPQEELPPEEILATKAAAEALAAAQDAPEDDDEAPTPE